MVSTLTPSSVIAHFDYDAGRRLLTIRFVTGRLYGYWEVPGGVAQAFREAESKGRFFNAHIRDHFNYREYATGAAHA